MTHVAGTKNRFLRQRLLVMLGVRAHEHFAVGAGVGREQGVFFSRDEVQRREATCNACKM